jgi:integrase
LGINIDTTTLTIVWNIFVIDWHTISLAHFPGSEGTMIRRAKLYARILEDGDYTRKAVAYDKHGKPIKPMGHVTTYQIRVAGKFIDAEVGNNFTMAISRLKQEQARLADGVSRVEAVNVVAPSHNPASGQSDRTRISDAADEFINELRTLDRKKYSIAMYKNALRDFRKSCHKEFLDQIDRKDILAFIGWMRDNMQVRVAGSENRTYRNKLGFLGTFLGRYGVQLRKEGKRQGASDPGLLFRSDIPKVVKKKPRKYDQSDIDVLMKHADADQKDYLMFLLWSGFRDEEVQYLQYSDFNFRNATVMVQSKPQFGWKPKDYEEREITLPSEVSKRMKERMDRRQQYRNGYRTPETGDLVFPNGEGNPDSHLIYRLHAVAEKAGLNLKGKRAGHMFRKTAGSRVAKKMGLPAAMEFLGHSDFATTPLYLAADKSDVTKKQQAADQMFEAGD